MKTTTTVKFILQSFLLVEILKLLVLEQNRMIFDGMIFYEYQYLNFLIEFYQGLNK
jgi:hypothetical protein